MSKTKTFGLIITDNGKETTFEVKKEGFSFPEIIGWVTYWLQKEMAKLKFKKPRKVNYILTKRMKSVILKERYKLKIKMQCTE